LLRAKKLQVQICWIERAELNGFHDVFAGDCFRSGKIGDGARHF